MRTKKIILLIMPLMAISFLTNCNSGNNPSKKTFTVTWQNDDGKVLEVDKNVPYGSKPSYDHEEPTKEDTKQYHYTFTGWDKDIKQKITQDTTFTAVYNDEFKKYDIVFLNDDKTLLYTQEDVPYDGKTVIDYVGETPSKEPTVQFKYDFAGWSPKLNDGKDVIRDEFINEKGEIIFTATFTATTQKYPVKFLDEDGTTLDEHEVPYGVKPEYNGPYPHKQATENKYFAFDGWDKAISPITELGDTYKATYKEINIEGLSAYIKLIIPDSIIYYDYTFSFVCAEGDTPTVDWGDGEVTNDGTTEHTYAKPGRYHVTIKNASKISTDLCKGKDYIYEVYLGKSVTSAGDVAFARCANLTIATIDAQMSSLERAFFDTCYSLISVDVRSNAIETINDEVFDSCSSLEKLYLPANLSYISSFAGLNRCVALSSIVIDESNETYYSGNSNSIITKKAVDDIPANTLIVGSSGSTIPDTVTSIGALAFQNRAIESIIVPSSVTSIGNYAFESCEYLVNVDLSAASGLTEIGDSTFANCFYLSTIKFNNGLEVIGYKAFAGCTSIESITLPSTVKTIDFAAFGGCFYLSSITLNDGLETIDDNAFYNCCISSINIPSTVSYIGENVFSGCDYLSSIVVDQNNENYRSSGNTIISNKDIDGVSANTLIAGCYNSIIPNDVVAIGNSAFSHCINLTTIEIPSSVKTIGGSAFDNCYYLSSVTFHEGLEEIGANAFNMCINLTTISLPSTVKTISHYAFNLCISLENIALSENLEILDNQVFGLCFSLVSITLPSKLNVISTALFAGCSFLESINIPSSVTSIKPAAFDGCYSLWNIDLTAFTTAESIPACANNVFYDCSEDLKLKVDSEAMADAFIAKGGGWAIDKKYYSWRNG